MTTPPPDAARRLLALATKGMPAHRIEWGAPLRAELASIEDPRDRRRFARSAGRAAFARGLGIRIGLGIVAVS